MPFIFDRFYRGDTARQTPGTGLGLSIVAQTITQHGGWIRAGRSAQGGAEFTIQLPGATSLEELTEHAESSGSGAPPVPPAPTAPATPASTPASATAPAASSSTPPPVGPSLAETGRKQQG
jgi:septal ring-binding cell division protein DamX